MTRQSSGPTQPPGDASPDRLPSPGEAPGRPDFTRSLGRLAVLAPMVAGSVALVQTGPHLATLAPGVFWPRWGGVASVWLAAVLSGWFASELLRAMAAFIRGHEERRHRDEQRLAEILERIVAALEAGPALSQAGPPAATDLRSLVQQAIRAEEWSQAESLIVARLRDRPDDEEARRLEQEFVDTRDAAAATIRAKLGAARDVNDAERVLELRDELVVLLPPDPVRELDRDLARWFMNLIQRRLRTGAGLTAVAVLAGRVAERMDTTPEGASLRAALPTLRRSGGLCPRCGQPYRGAGDACPACLDPASIPADDGLDDLGNGAPVDPDDAWV